MNTLAYLALSAAAKEKSFITLAPGVNVIKLFSSSLPLRPIKLDHFYLAINFQSSLTFAGNTRSLPKREHLKGAPVGFALGLLSNSKTWLESCEGFPGFQ